MEILTKYQVGDLVGDVDGNSVGKIVRIEIVISSTGMSLRYSVRGYMVDENKLFPYVKVDETTKVSDTNTDKIV